MSLAHPVAAPNSLKLLVGGQLWSPGPQRTARIDAQGSRSGLSLGPFVTSWLANNHPNRRRKRRESEGEPGRGESRRCC